MIKQEELLLAEALGRYSAYGYCARQFDCLECPGMDPSEPLRQIKNRIERRYLESADDYQAVANRLLGGKENQLWEELKRI